MGDDHPGHPALAAGPDETHDGLPVDGVERAGRLVGEQQMPVTDDGTGDRHSLPLAAGQLVREPVGAVGEAELLERVRRGNPRRLDRRAVELQRK